MSYTTHPEKRYNVLRVIGTIYKVLGGIVAVVTVLGAIGVCIASLAGGAAASRFAREMGAGGLSVIGGLIGGLLTLLYGGGLAVTLYAFGEGVSLVLALEENTRATAMLLERQFGQSSKRASEPPARLE